jgi:RND superfamily putative drug exporter
LIGVGIAVAVVLDATIIRMILVPASIKLFGEYNFYCPYYLQKVVDFVGLVESEDGLDSLDEENERGRLLKILTKGLKMWRRWRIRMMARRLNHS